MENRIAFIKDSNDNFVNIIGRLNNIFAGNGVLTAGYAAIVVGDVMDEDNEYMAYLKLYKFLFCRMIELKSDVLNIVAGCGNDEFPVRLESFVQKLCRVADHASHEIEDLKPAPPVEEFTVTEEMMDEALRAGAEEHDFSIGFLQRHFCIGFSKACKLQEALIKKCGSPRGKN